ncbi:MAG: glutamate 5-kinase [Actinomycetia bacterium]|nr:glutamate 5-kinase [Actinomycetes bacterium]
MTRRGVTGVNGGAAAIDSCSAACYRRIVVKIGSSTLTDEHGQIDEAYIAHLSVQLAILKAGGAEILLVTSGAIAAGLEGIGLTGRPTDVPSLQAASAVGQLRLAQCYSQAFAVHDLRLGQVLLTRFELQNRSSYLHARDTLERLLAGGVIPLINENDTVAVEEIRFGDNDSLAAQVGMMVKADLVVLLSDIEGLYTADPRVHEDAELLESIAAFTTEIVAAAGAAGTTRGSGGMVTKLEAARICMAAGIPMVICQGSEPNVVLEVACGKPHGTLFAAAASTSAAGGQGTSGVAGGTSNENCHGSQSVGVAAGGNGRSSDDDSHQRGSRKLWLALAAAPMGTVHVDAGAEAALRQRGSSLLPVGIRLVEGDFGAGDTVDIRNPEGLIIGRGISSYSAPDLARAAGMTSKELVSHTDVGRPLPNAAIHRDQLVVF